ncbi:protein ENHANCED DISEASE RESISTANCE 2-like [Citrus clementina]|uniref:protein ENHANCED DISEASE RESISTANCE 2-like n=1 Tax=Citrus clementina TaxID=85681 RepID=UPI000CED0BB2|nr:protein ENHANCED DISEASE RESISTANCE 2-like [Citrus x clementina]XP_024040174.1 protein ENHANCED DISEASE RESISTANCE 2-like [Citrus x clementina]
MDHVARRQGCAAQGSWIVRHSVGSTTCLLGKAVDCNYLHGPKYLEIDVDIGSSTVANGVLGLVNGVITTLVVDMAFLVQANTTDELPERLIGVVRVSSLLLSQSWNQRHHHDCGFISPQLFFFLIEKKNHLF